MLKVQSSLQRVESVGGVLEWVAARPGATVRGAVRSYTGYREQTEAPQRRTEVPSGQVTLVLGFEDGFSAEPVRASGSFSPFTSFVAGLHHGLAGTKHGGRQSGLQVRLDPLGAYSLLGVPMHELGDRVVELSDVLGADAERWSACLLATRCWEDRFDLLEQLLHARMAAGPRPSPQVAWAWKVMRRAGGDVRILDLAKSAGCSHRHLVARFREQVGTTPKAAARILRYERASRLLARGEATPAQVSTACRDADQSHLTREFTRLAGTTPAAARGSSS